MKLMKLYFLIFTRRHIRWYSAHTRTHSHTHTCIVCVRVFAISQEMRGKKLFGRGHTYISIHDIQHTYTLERREFLLHKYQRFLPELCGFFPFDGGRSRKSKDSDYMSRLLAPLKPSTTVQHIHSGFRQTPNILVCISFVQCKILRRIKTRTRKQWIFFTVFVFKLLIFSSYLLFGLRYACSFFLIPMGGGYTDVYVIHICGNNHNWWWVGKYQDIVVVGFFLVFQLVLLLLLPLSS